MEFAQHSVFPVPIDQRYFEDYVPGACYAFDDTVTVDQDAVIAFATEFDPQSFHTDPAAAASGPFGGLIASGWHTSALMMRLFATHYLSTTASLGGPGVDELRWLVPVRPGDTLRLRATVLDARRSRSKPDRGLVTTRAELLNQERTPALTLTVLNLLRARQSTGAPEPAAS
jgi:acyl dehydratase